ncbi:unnamed protein product [Clonostachys rosea]|uniref:Uncharacterized protein n=1 Tax=Bionectria ochroleuca TaxID=29856 RepID=A0ABY6U9V2_BIOOC|nr:unnamed protein product [Clonostachys rosea]
MRYLVSIPSPGSGLIIDAKSGEPSFIQAIVDKEPSIIYNPHFSSSSNENMASVNDQASPSAGPDDDDEDEDDRLFHIVTPDPEEYSPITHSKTNESYYFLKLGRGRDYYNYQKAKSENPVCSLVVGDIPQAEEEEEEEEEEPVLNEWYKVIPKSEDELADEYEESEAPEAWTHDDLRSNLIAQQSTLRNGENEEYEQLMQQLLEMCNIRQETDVERD